MLLVLPVLGVMMSSPPESYHTWAGPETLRPIERRVLKVVTGAFAAHGEPAPSLAGALVQACRSAADAILTEPQAASTPEIVRASLEFHGVTDLTTYPFTIPCGEEGPSPGELQAIVATHLRGRGVTHMGAGVSQGLDREGRRLLLLVFLQQRVALDPFPRATEWGQPLALSGAVPPDSGFPRVLVATPAGRVLDAEVYVGDGTQFWAPLEFAHGPGRYLVEVLSADRHGPQVANLFAVHVGEPAPRVPELRVLPPDPPDATPASLEARMLELLNRDRLRFGLSPLRPEPRLAAAARDHSADMARRDYFGHACPEGEGVTARLSRRNVATRLSAEVISIATSTSKGHADLMRSPSHRRAMLDPRMTHAGVGIVPVDEGASRRLVITEIFAVLP